MAGYHGVIVAIIHQIDPRVVYGVMKGWTLMLLRNFRRMMLCGVIFICALAACKEVDSVPVFDEGRLTVEALNDLEGRYVSDNISQSIVVQRASTETDLLSWIWTDDQKEAEIARGNLVVSQVPASNLYLALILDMEAINPDGQTIGGKGKNFIAFIRKDSRDSFVLIPVNEAGFLAKMIDRIPDPDQQRASILQYAQEHAAVIAAIGGVDYTRQVNVAPAPVPVDRVAQAAQQQCRNSVADRLLYCRQITDAGSYSTTYVIDCPGGSRSEKRECRGPYVESTYPNVGFEPYYCDPQTDIKGATSQQVVERVCR